MKNAVKITAMPMVERYDQGQSKFFGSPAVPNSWKDTFPDDEVFICQIRLEDLVQFESEHMLPQTGYLYFFVRTEGNKLTPHIMYYDGEPDTLIDNFNSIVPEFSHLVNDTLVYFESCDGLSDGTRLFGSTQNLDAEYKDKKLLMLFDTRSLPTPFFKDKDAQLYFFFGESCDLSDVELYIKEV